jgi:hypothetical protein
MAMSVKPAYGREATVMTARDKRNGPYIHIHAVSGAVK